jgi:serine protease Do
MKSSQRNRQLVTLSLVAGAVVFGMVLAGGLQWTTPGAAEPQHAALSATQLASNGALARELPSFADLAQAVNPAVVSIEAATIGRGDNPRRRGQQGQGGQGQGQGIDPFEFFFGPRGRQQQPQRPDREPEEYRSDSGGSGFVISSDGLIVTNNHVVDGATDIKVRLGERQYTAKVKGVDPDTDLALLKIDAGKPLQYLELGDSEHLRVGDWVMVVGNPLNLDHTVTTGVVSAKGRSIGVNGRDISFENFIQTDAAINFGNSGGPLLNLQGQVVGIATAINYGAENIGFAVPINTLRGVLPQLRDKGKVSRGYLGLGVDNLTFENAKAWKLDAPNGALVNQVTDGSPADAAGVKPGDIIVRVDDIDVKTTRDLIDYVSSRGPDTTVRLDIVREGKHLDRKVKLSERPGTDSETKPETRGEDGAGRIDWLGLRYEDLSSGNRSENGLPNKTNGILVTEVSPSSPLFDQGVRQGCVITEVNGQSVSTVADFERLVKALPNKQYLRLYIRVFGRNGESRPFFAVVQAP